MRHIYFILFTLTIGLFLSSCKDDDTFSVSSSNLLTFQDTLSLDTVFTRIPTSAKYFWVYNNSGDGIRCSNIRLEHGNQTGFRVNVDGEYLGSTNGYKVNNVEIRKGDSIRVFVELTAKPNYEDGLQLKEENLILQLESGIEQKVNLRAITWDADTVHTLRISKDTTINTYTRPLIVFNNIKVDSAATLSIAQGSTIYFHDNAGIEVNGTLKCLGDSTANITLRTYRLDHMFDYLLYDELPGHWQGIHFYPSSYGNEINFTDIHGAYDGVVCDSSNVDKLKLTINSSIIHNCQGYGLLEDNSLVDVFNSQISNTLYDCVRVLGGAVTLQQCTLAQFYPFDSTNRGSALLFTNLSSSLKALNVYNSIITGYDDDVIMAEQSKDSTYLYNYNFQSSLLRTPEVKDSLHFKNIIWETPEDSINGDKQFVLVDIDNQKYDFHLDSLSTVRGKGDPQYALPYNRDGKPRDKEHPDLGCY